MKRMKSDAGVSLVELIVYMPCLLTIIGIAFAAFYQCRRNSLDLARNADDIVAAVTAGEIWREDIRRAARPPEVVDGVLHIPLNQGETVYRVSEKAVWRKTPKTGEWTVFVPYVASSRMLVEPGKHVDSCRWELELHSAPDARVRPLFTFRAVPGSVTQSNEVTR